MASRTSGATLASVDMVAGGVKGRGGYLIAIHAVASCRESASSPAKQSVVAWASDRARTHLVRKLLHESCA